MVTVLTIRTPVLCSLLFYTSWDVQSLFSQENIFHCYNKDLTRFTSQQFLSQYQSRKNLLLFLAFWNVCGEICYKNILILTTLASCVWWEVVLGLFHSSCVTWYRLRPKHSLITCWLTSTSILIILLCWRGYSATFTQHLCFYILSLSMTIMQLKQVCLSCE